MILLSTIAFILSACSEDKPTEEPAGCNNTINLLHAETLEPSVIRLFFTIRDCDNNGITDKVNADFTLSENGAQISSYESLQDILPSSMGYDLRTLLLLDMSGSMVNSGNLEPLQIAAKQFVESLSDNQMVGIYAFDGRQQIQEIVDFTQNKAALNLGIDALSDYQQTDSSTNLNGSVISASQLLDAYATQTTQGLFKGTLVVFTDGTDQAGWSSDGNALTVLESSNNAVYSIGLGAEADNVHLHSIGRDGSWMANNVSELNSVFTALSSVIINQAESLYMLAYCSPKRNGAHSLELKVDSMRLNYDFIATGFAGGCSHLDFFAHDNVEELSPGDLVISEIMHDPGLVTDFRGEWFEIHNPTTRHINLRGLHVAGNGLEGFDIDKDIILQPGGFSLLAARDNPLENGGMTNVDFRYLEPNFDLAATDTIALESPDGLTIDVVSYSEALGFPAAYATSLNLNQLDAVLNDEGANWCVSISPFGDGDLGTPGWSNDPCF